ncbi:MBL fold metallo-hydrolase [Methanococcoides methylutens]|uniref:7,8 dihydropteroate synthase (Methanopterin) n=1 Tax=Methanococcoides methylutens MM1 TaxID=1434104 RepID=A0A0E3WZI9_METMT|nr:MBL fold metallo-hydrolase [Methanococcoides methylutens]AKB84329.1 7,8 dihydropteroate synthase (methanopterin) [Methanococcoides methylutens MM1]
MKVTIVYDNEAKPPFRKGWGFSCYIETEDRKILFDTGWDGCALRHNLSELNIPVENIDILVLSHQHWDHIGGLPVILNTSRNLEVFVPASFSEKLKKEISAHSTLHEVTDRCRICNNVFSTGELGNNPKEQSLMLETAKGIFVITGCAHPGLEAIIGAAASEGEVCGIIGGLHDSREYELLEGLEFIGAGHCTSNIDTIKSMFPDTFVPIEAGYSFEI